MNRNQLNGNKTVWGRHRGKRVIIQVPDQDESFLGSRTPTILNTLERSTDELIKLLEPPKEHLEVHTQVYLVDHISVRKDDAMLPIQAKNASMSQDLITNTEAIVHIMHPGDHDELLLFPFIRTLVQRWIGKQAASATFFLQGLTGVVAARTGIGTEIEKINFAIQTELKQARTVSIFPSSPANGLENATQGIVSNDIAASFVAFLIETFGNKAFQQFLAMYDQDRQDQAALAAYHRPLGQLEEAWLVQLRKSDPKKNAMVTFAQHILPLLRPYWLRGILVILYSIVGLSFNVVAPLSSIYLLDTILPEKNAALLLLFTAGLSGFYLLTTLAGLHRSQVTAYIVQHMMVDLQQKTYNHLQNLSHHFFSHARVGDLMSRLSNDVRMVQLAVSQVLGSVIFMICNTIIASIILFTLHPIIGGLIIAILPLLAASYILLGKRLQQVSAENQKRIGEIAAVTQENISAHAVIKAFGLAQRSSGSYRSHLLLQLKTAVRLAVVSAFFQNSLFFASLLGQVIVLAIGGYLVIQGHITLGTLLAALTVLPSLFAPVALFGSLVETIQTAAGAMERIVELQNEPVTITDKPGALTLPPVVDEIRLEQVTFGYESDHIVLKNLNLSIPAGSNIALVGPSGSGKSSIANLLMRFWDPGEGRILFDGHDLRDVTLASLKGQIGLVFQDTFVFDTTVRENIAIGRPEATDSEIIAAARGARLDEYINTLPAGYNTVLGERGVRMSGGQRQRLAIARVLLRNPRILILDEATSALDSQTEREILETLDDLKRGRTTISITHRLTTASTADHILVLEQGRIVEQGTHDELLQRYGLYQRLYQEQTSRHNGHISPGIDPTRLQTIPLFKEIKGELLEKVAQQLVRTRFVMGEYILRQGEPGDTFSIINYGQVEVLLNDRDTKRRISILDEGDFFGEISLLIDEPHTASVRAIFPTECYILTKASFSILLEQEPQIREILWRSMRQRRSELAAIQAFMRQTGPTNGLLAAPTTTLFSSEQVAQAYGPRTQR